MDMGRERGALSHFPAGKFVSVKVGEMSRVSKADFIAYSLGIIADTVYLNHAEHNGPLISYILMRKWKWQFYSCTLNYVITSKLDVFSVGKKKTQKHRREN